MFQITTTVGLSLLILLIIFFLKNKKLPKRDIALDLIFNSILFFTGLNLVLKYAISSDIILFNDLAPYEPIYLFSIGVFIAYTGLERIYDKMKRRKY